MADKLSSTQRKYCMSRIRGKNTKPEILVRKGLHARGFRFRLHHKKLPGSPDIVLPKYSVAIMVNGCFWHGHKGCRYATKPKSNVEFWETKIVRNRHRDEVTNAHLEALGWHVITVWECELRGESILASRLDELAEEIRHAGVLKKIKKGRSDKLRRPQENTGKNGFVNRLCWKRKLIPCILYQRKSRTLLKVLRNMNTIEVVAAIILKEGRLFATQRGYGEFKGWWEFPGGKMEPGECPQEALKREIREELDAEVEVRELLETVEWDYPNFHLTMHCFICSLLSESLHLNEHEAATWLTHETLRSVKWLPADEGLLIKVAECLR